MWFFSSWESLAALRQHLSWKNLHRRYSRRLLKPYHPLTTQTGIGSIDQILSAVASGDTEALRSLVEFTNAPCTQQDGLGGPPKCREGEVEGTPVDVLPFLGGEGSFLRKDEIGNSPGIDVTSVYAVYEVNAAAISSEEYYPIGKYVILFVGEGNQPAVALRIGEQGIVRVEHIFGFFPRIFASDALVRSLKGDLL